MPFFFLKQNFLTKNKKTHTRVAISIKKIKKLDLSTTGTKPSHGDDTNYLDIEVICLTFQFSCF